MLFLLKWSTGEVEAMVADSAEALAARLVAEGYGVTVEKSGRLCVEVADCVPSFAVPVAPRSVEVCAAVCDLGGNKHNASWVVVRGDDEAFAGLVAMGRYRLRVRPVHRAWLYCDGTRYDSEGPC